MRTPTTSTTVAALVMTLGLGAAPPASAASAAPAPHPCGHHAGARFPIDARLQGGPARYTRGGAWVTWRVRLRNTTGTDCRAVHPVVVLADAGRALRPRDIGFAFLDGEGGQGRWRRVAFVRTDEDENVGAFAGFPGFDVPARRTVDVPVRIRFAAGAPGGEVTANVTTVQRRDDDGSWVGQSRDHSFRVVAPRGGPRAEAGPGAASGPDAGKEAGSGRRGALPPSLATTGRGQALLGLGVTSVVCVLLGIALLARSRRARRGPGR